MEDCYVLPIYRNLGLWWVKPRSFVWWDFFMLDTYDDSHWKWKLKIKSDMEKQNTHYRHLVLVPIHLAVMLYKLMKNLNYNELAEQFAFGEAIVHEIILETTKAIAHRFAYKIKFPES
ncbi:hypothetical protein SELMODRAFT_418039 [Selaginella moellendorffii]|uniref:Uncharacterized protein n=1 Tax=Selaginella moellendorffii TaxID=88036 RepID=D8S4G5_SELML|nr:hypothetical protein SELMODRAFT_418039 [Selaginella moellendorffii]